MAYKKRVLFCNEASYLSTGFSTYGLEVMRRLHATSKYELAEFATYGDTSDPSDRRWEEVAWGFYPVKPNCRDEGEVEEYNRDPLNQFGKWRFEQVLCDFRPDVVIDPRDWWHCEFEERSPFRPYFHWSLMPTCDATPQDEAWLATYAAADSVFAYTDWGLEVLRTQSNGVIKTACPAPPGADYETLVPVPDKRAHKRQLQLSEDALVVGTVMRNQKRKLYPALIESFARFLREAPRELARRSYLYLHVCYPDVGWEIPRLVKEAGVGSRTLFTYACGSCGVSFPSFYMDTRAYCRACGRHAATLPSSENGVSRAVLAMVYNFMDCYVQYASNEGFGMPMVEAAACGLPVLAVDYSAMADIVRKVKGLPLKVLGYVRECETGCDKAVPDNDDLVAKLVHVLSLPGPVRLKKGRDARAAAMAHYHYDRTAKVWEDHIDGLRPIDHSQTWRGPPRLHTPARGVPDGLSDEEFVRWGLTHVAGRPDLANSYLALRIAKDLTWGATLFNTPKSVFSEMSLLGTNFRPSNYDRGRALREMLQMCEHRNFWETRRAEMAGRTG